MNKRALFLIASSLYPLFSLAAVRDDHSSFPSLLATTTQSRSSYSRELKQESSCQRDHAKRRKDIFFVYVLVKDV